MGDGFSLDSLKESAQEASDAVERNTKTLCPWLEDPHVCGECGAHCDSTRNYVESQVMIMDIWKCPECGSRYYRERV
jgi:DNA-directed RNA polymerase subunit RPC12/RpoP